MPALMLTVQSKEALQGCVSLARWVVIHHLERLQTVFPVAGADTTRRNLADTLRYISVTVLPCVAFMLYRQSYKPIVLALA